MKQPDHVVLAGVGVVDDVMFVVAPAATCMIAVIEAVPATVPTVTVGLPDKVIAVKPGGIEIVSVPEPLAPARVKHTHTNNIPGVFNHEPCCADGVDVGQVIVGV